MRSARPVGPGYAPRFAARGKRYRYRVLVDPVRDPALRARSWRVADVDMAAVALEARAALGTHDFVAFRSSGDQRDNTVRTLSRVDVEREAHPGIVAVVVEGNAFLYNMVRILVGTMIDVGRGRLEPGAVARALESRDRRPGGHHRAAARAGPRARRRRAAERERRPMALTQEVDSSSRGRAPMPQVRACGARCPARAPRSPPSGASSGTRTRRGAATRARATTAVYARVASRLDEDARVRAGRPVLGSHAHLVAELDGAPCGQVEGWLERRGSGASGPSRLRGALARRRSDARAVWGRAARCSTAGGTAQALAPAAPCVLAAEVLEPNPAHAFYARVGFAARGLERVRRSCGRRAGTGKERRRARRAAGRCARRIGRLAARGNPGRPPTRGGRSALRAAARHRRHPPRRPSPRTSRPTRASKATSATIVAVDREGRVRGAASVIVQTLEPPFLAVRRSLVGRFALDPACPPLALLVPLVALACRFARGARRRPGRTDRPVGPRDRAVRRRSRHRRASLVARRCQRSRIAGSLPSRRHTVTALRHELPRSCRGSACARARPGWRHLSGIRPGPGRSGRALG